MRTILLSISIGLCVLVIQAQSVSTSYVKGIKSSYCGEENYRFSFDDSYFKKVDNYDGSSISGPSRKEVSGYDGMSHKNHSASEHSSICVDLSL